MNVAKHDLKAKWAGRHNPRSSKSHFRRISDKKYFMEVRRETK